MKIKTLRRLTESLRNSKIDGSCKDVQLPSILLYTTRIEPAYKQMVPHAEKQNVNVGFTAVSAGKRVEIPHKSVTVRVRYLPVRVKKAALRQPVSVFSGIVCCLVGNGLFILKEDKASPL